MMTQALKGKTRAEAEGLFQRFHRLLTSEVSAEEAEELGKLAVFAGVRKFPGAGQVRHPGLAHSPRRPGRWGGNRIDGVGVPGSPIV